MTRLRTIEDIRKPLRASQGVTEQNPGIDRLRLAASWMRQHTEHLACSVSQWNWKRMQISLSQLDDEEVVELLSDELPLATNLRPRMSDEDILRMDEEFASL